MIENEGMLICEAVRSEHPCLVGDVVADLDMLDEAGRNAVASASHVGLKLIAIGANE